MATFPGGPGLAGTRMFPFWIFGARTMEVVKTLTIGYKPVLCYTSKDHHKHHYFTAKVHTNTPVMFNRTLGCPYLW